MNHFSIGLIVTCNEKYILYDNRRESAQWLDWEAPKHFPKPNLHQKNVTVTVWWSVPVWSTTALWSWRNITREKCAQQVDKMHWKLQRLQLELQKGPNSPPWQHLTVCGTTSASEVEWIGLQSFASSSIFTWPLDNQIPLLQSSWQLFAGKMFPRPAESRKCFPRVCRIPKHWFLHYRNIPTYSSGKNVLLLIVPILINKEVFEPS